MSLKSRSVGFIGLGRMGKGMATNLVRSFDLTVFDLRTEPMEELRKLGARRAHSAGELGSICDYIVTMLRNTEQTNEVIFGKDGLWAGVKEGATLVISSTIDQQFVRQVKEKALHRHVGVLDAPVSGGINGAKNGTLTIMVGGEEDLFKECQPLFKAMGKELFYMGGSGSGLTAKVVNNAVWYMNMFSLREGLKLGSAAGVDPQNLLEVIRVSTGGSTVAQRWDEYKDNEFQNIEKDISLAMAMAKSAGVKLPVLGLTSQFQLRDR